MSYQIRHDETLADGFRRICRKQVMNAVAIARGDVETDGTVVHQTRKHLKKARAALQLLASEIGHSAYKRTDRYLRDVGRMISEIRDAEVRLQTVQQVQHVTRRQTRRTYRKIEEVLVLELVSFMAAFAEWQKKAVPKLECFLKEIDGWPLDHFGYKRLCRSVQKSYKTGRDCLARAQASPSAETFHEFRSEAKRLGYQLRILRPINPVVLKNLTDEVGALGDLLGRAHDFSFLGERLRQERGSQPWQREANELLAVIEASEAELERGAAELAERFFAERPREFGDRLANWFHIWTNGKLPSVAGALVAGEKPRDALRAVN